MPLSAAHFQQRPHKLRVSTAPFDLDHDENAINTIAPALSSARAAATACSRPRPQNDADFSCRLQCAQVMRSRIEPMKKVAKTLKAHRLLILNWFKARGLVALGAVEGMNNRLKVITRRSYGFRTFRATEVALYHSLSALPDPQSQFAHRFC
jgi:transposase